MSSIQRIVFYDGECRFCNAAVSFILERDKRGQFHFAPRESAFAEHFFRVEGLKRPEVDSIIYCDGGNLFVESEAAMAIAKELGGVWSWIRMGRILPASWRNGLYRWVARNRYHWFGKAQKCRIPTVEQAGRFHFDVP